jgi:hypothetical protein
VIEGGLPEGLPSPPTIEGGSAAADRPSERRQVGATSVLSAGWRRPTFGARVGQGNSSALVKMTMSLTDLHRASGGATIGS